MSRTSTRVTKLRVTKVKQGMKIRLRCTPRTGKGCPKELRGDGRSFTLRNTRTKSLLSLVKQARLRPGGTLEVRVLEAGAIGRLDTFKIRDDKRLKRTQRCIAPGRTKAEKCA